MTIIRTLAELRRHIAGLRAAGRRIGLLPTMGALHEGHLQLCDVARRHADAIVLSVFVNPLQFGAGEDFERYPRDLERDAELARDRGVSLLFAPDAAEVYPDGTSQVRVYAPALGNVLCGRFRPGHFEGVLTVVAKLFSMVRPDSAVFGQKDLQQHVLIRRMVRDLNFDIEIVVAPTVREADGLAMSSRNAYLSPVQRAAAVALPEGLRAAQRAFDDGVADPARIVAATAAILQAAPGVSPQYVEVVDPGSLMTSEPVQAGHVVAVAAHIGRTRLIDNHVLTAG